MLARPCAHVCRRALIFVLLFVPGQLKAPSEALLSRADWLRRLRATGWTTVRLIAPWNAKDYLNFC